MNKVLFISNHAGFSKFNAPYMQWFHENGWQVDNASPGIETGYYDNQYDLPISRSPFAIKNLKALIELKKICKKNNYDLIHCHTPVGGVLGRLCVNIKKCNTKVIYTAHGFHFFRGASKFSWMIFYPIEKLLSKRTNLIVTINEEDYEIAKKNFKCRIEKINGVGVNLERFIPVNSESRQGIRLENSLRKEDFVLVYCAQFIPRKNHKFLIDHVKELKNIIPELKVCLIGSGSDLEDTKIYVKQKQCENFVYLLGYRKDVEKLYAISDVLVSTSLQEGFPINVIEGMACGLPVVISNIRGHRDIVGVAKENKLFDFFNDSFDSAILNIYKDKKLYDDISKKNIEYAKFFSIENSLERMAKIYREVMEL